MPATRNLWITFQEYFELAETECVDLIDAAEALLKGIKANHNAISVAGLRRVWDQPTEAEQREWINAERKIQDLFLQLDVVPPPLPERKEALERELRALRQTLKSRYDYRERLPRDPQLRNVPKSLWGMVDCINPDLSSFWVDDLEEPCETARVEWLAGTIEVFDWDQREAYEALCLERNQARKTLKLLSGNADRRGAPRGPRSPMTQAAVAGVLDARNAGDTRDIGKIAWDFIPKEIAKTEKGSLINRQVIRHVKAALAGAKK